MKSVKISLYLTQDTRSREGIEALLAAWDERGLVADRGSFDEFCREPFSAPRLIDDACFQTFDGLGFFVARRAAPAWSGYISFCTKKLSFLAMEITTGDLASTRSGFEHATALARSLKPAFGHAFATVGAVPYDNLDIKEQPERYGLRRFFARSFFGPGVAARVGDRLAGVVASSTPYHGGVEVDLLPEPWAAPWEALHAASDAATAACQDTGLFGDYEARPRPKAPAGWAGVPR